MTSTPLASRARAAVAPLLLFAPALAAQATVWTVDAGGAGDFAAIQDAVDAAADGDVILVQPGGYAPFRISGKGLRIHGFGGTVFNGSDPAVETVLIEGTAPHQSVVLDGISVLAFAPGAPSTVHVAGCAGPVWLHNVFSDSFGAAALHVEASASVVLDRCLLQTNVSTPSPTGTPQPVPGALIDAGARVFAYDSQFIGSHGPFVMGGVPAVTEPEDGGAGIVLVDAVAHLQGCGLSGGTGSTFSVSGCLTGGDGGAGALLLSAGGTPPELLVTGGLVQPGGGGFFNPGCAPAPAPGVPFDVQAGSAQHSTATPRLLAVPEGAPASGELVQLTFEGAAGDLFLLFASSAPAPALTLPLGGSPFGLDLHLAPAPLVLVHTGALAAAVSTLALPAPALPPGLAAATPALQAVFVDAQGALHAATPRALTILAP